MIGAGFPNNGLGLESPATLKYARTFGKQSTLIRDPNDDVRNLQRTFVHGHVIQKLLVEFICHVVAEAAELLI